MERETTALVVRVKKLQAGRKPRFGIAERRLRVAEHV
jgi:hypothetical protein